MFIAHDHPRFRPVIDAISAVLFIGTVHSDDGDTFEKVFVRCAAAELGCSSKSSVVRIMSSNGYLENMRLLCTDFRGLVGLSCRFVNFYEKNPTLYKNGSWLWYPRSKRKMVRHRVVYSAYTCRLLK